MVAVSKVSAFADAAVQKVTHATKSRTASFFMLFSPWAHLYRCARMLTSVARRTIPNGMEFTGANSIVGHTTASRDEETGCSSPGPSEMFSNFRRRGGEVENVLLILGTLLV